MTDLTFNVKHELFSNCNLFGDDKLSDAILRFINAEGIFYDIPIIKKYVDSDFFRTLFNSPMRANIDFDLYNRPIYKITIPLDVSFSYYKVIIAYLYGCYINYQLSDITILFFLADYFRIITLPYDIVNNIYFNYNIGLVKPQHILSLIKATLYTQSKLYLGVYNELNKYLMEIIAKNFTDLQTDLLYIDDIQLLSDILRRDDLNVDSEIRIVNFLEKWHFQYPDKNYVLEYELIPFIRMATLSKNNLISISNSPLNIFYTFKQLIIEAQNHIPSYNNVLPNNRDMPRVGVVYRQLKYKDVWSNYIIAPYNINWEYWPYDRIDKTVYVRRGSYINKLIEENKIGPGTMINVGLTEEDDDEYIISDVIILYGRTPEIIWQHN